MNPYLLSCPCASDLWIEKLQLENFRCFDKEIFQFDPGINVAWGVNGCGKTTILEAISFLLNKRSFRTNRRTQLIRRDEESALLVAYARTQAEESDRLAALIQRSGLQMKWGDQTDPVRSDLVRSFPSVLLEPRLGVEFFHEADVRRRWIDETVFHVEHRFLPAWQKFQRALSQRNAALSQSPEQVERFTPIYIESAMGLHALRQPVFDSVRDAFHAIRDQFESDVLADITISYRCGWNTDEGLAAHLERTAEGERRRSHTLVGPQRADVVLQTADGQARDWLSRGQQKLAILCLKLAQLSRLQAHGVRPLLLWDDWQSELSEDTQRLALHILRHFECQAILTTPQQNWPDSEIPPARMFHVKH